MAQVEVVVSRPPMGIELSGIWIYPIKSCRGIALESAEVVRRGFARDRRYMLVDESGKFITQREVHALALVEVALADDGFRVAAAGRELALPLQVADGPRLEVEVWSSRCAAIVHPAGSAWFSEYLERPCRLVFMPDDVERAVSPTHAQPGDIVSFTDGYPFLLLGEASVQELGRRLAQLVPIRRFRPSLVVRGAPAHAEDDWKVIRIGALRFRVVKPCSRCVITTLDPDTGVGGKEPLRTLATYRERDGEVMFGQNLIHEGTGTLRVGDRVTVEHEPIVA